MPVQDQQMERTSVSIPKAQLDQISKRVESGEFPNQSEFIRSAVREYNERHPAAEASA